MRGAGHAAHDRIQSPAEAGAGRFTAAWACPLRTTYNKEKVLAEMLHDKKAQGGQITIIKVPGLGCWRAETIPVEGLRPLLGMEE